MARPHLGHKHLMRRHQLFTDDAGHAHGGIEAGRGDQHLKFFLQNGAEDKLDAGFAIGAGDADLDQIRSGGKLLLRIAEVHFAHQLLNRPGAQSAQRDPQGKQQREQADEIQPRFRARQQKTYQRAQHREHNGRGDAGTLHAHGDHEGLLGGFHLHEAAAPVTAEDRQGDRDAGNQQTKHTPLFQVAVDAAVNQEEQHQIGGHDQAWQDRARKIPPDRAEIAGELVALQLEIVHQDPAGQQGGQAHTHRNQPHNQCIHREITCLSAFIRWFPPENCGQWLQTSPLVQDMQNGCRH